MPRANRATALTMRSDDPPRDRLRVLVAHAALPEKLANSNRDTPMASPSQDS